jgi:multidrug resistance protein, MATE family
MTQSHIETIGSPADTTETAWAREVIETIKLALPMALTQLGQVAMMTTDLVLIGRLGDAAIAAASLAHTVFFTAFVLGMGLVSAVSTLAAQAFGAREPRMVRRALRVGLWTAILAGVPLTLTQAWGREILILFGQAPEVAALAHEYLAGLALSLIPFWVFIALRGFMGAVNRPEPALWITLLAVPANAALGYALIYGAFGFPRFEMFGAGLATSIVNVAMCAAAFWVVTTQRPFRKYRPLGRFWRYDGHLLRKLFAIGLPISGAFLMEFGLFASAALLMGRIGTAALAAHQIALQTAAIMFMVPFGISMAATVRVGHAVGRNDPAGRRRAGFAALTLAAIFMAAMTVLVVLTRHAIPHAFLGESAARAPETVALAATLLLAGASFFIADGLQTVAAGALRGLSDTRVPLVIAAFSYWAIGFVAALLLGFTFGLGAIGIWSALTLALVTFAILLVWRFHHLTRDGIQTVPRALILENIVGPAPISRAESRAPPSP